MSPIIRSSLTIAPPIVKSTARVIKSNNANSTLHVTRFFSGNNGRKNNSSFSSTHFFIAVTSEFIGSTIAKWVRENYFDR